MMHRLFASLFCFCLFFTLAAWLAAGCSAPARADVFVWQDPDSGVSLSIPDRWNVVHNQGAGDVFTALAPGGGAAQCKLRVDPDIRYVIFPADFGSDVQRVAVSADFWTSYLGAYDEHRLDRVFDGAGLGRWHASYAQASYRRHNGTRVEERRALMFAALYYDRVYIVECSTAHDDYAAWDPVFRSIVKSIDFKKIYHEIPSGHYKNFIKDADLYFWAQGAPEGTSAY